jgi:SAM-dependent methyltransferase
LERLGLAMPRFVPRVGSNISVNRVVALMRDMLSSVADPKILVVGGGDTGAGLDSFLDDPRYTIVESDVYFGPRSNLIADGHNLPFQSECFGAVICQAVLEHVARSHDCIDEMHRVLKPGGVLFVDVPFLFPVHMPAGRGAGVEACTSPVAQKLRPRIGGSA